MRHDNTQYWRTAVETNGRTRANTASERNHATASSATLASRPCTPCSIPTRTQPKWHCLGHTGMNSYLRADEAHTQTHRSTGRIHHQPDRKQRKPHAQTPISVTNAAKLAPMRGCGALRGDKTHDGSCRQQAFDEAPSHNLLHSHAVGAEQPTTMLKHTA